MKCQEEELTWFTLCSGHLRINCYVLLRCSGLVFCRGMEIVFQWISLEQSELLSA